MSTVHQAIAAHPDAYQQARAREWLGVAIDALALAGVEDHTAPAMVVVNRCRRLAASYEREAAGFGIDGNRQVGLHRGARLWQQLAAAVETTIKQREAA